MSVAVNQNSTIQKTVVPGHLRASTLPKRFPAMFLVYESLVYRYLEIFSNDLQTGYWEFVELSNGGFYMSLQSPKTFHLYIPSSGFEGEMSADAASVIVNLFAQCHLANQHELDGLIGMCHALREYAREHAEACLIRKAID